jgi:hypothetical protein
VPRRRRSLRDAAFGCTGWELIPLAGRILELDVGLNFGHAIVASLDDDARENHPDIRCQFWVTLVLHPIGGRNVAQY